MQSVNTANNSDSAKWLTILEAAARVGVSPDTIRRRVKSGLLPASWFAGAYRIKVEDLEELVGKDAA